MSRKNSNSNQYLKENKSKEKLLQTFVDDDNSKMNYNSRYQSSNDLLSGMTYTVKPKKSLYIGGGFGTTMDDITGFDDTLKEPEYRESIFRNQRLTLANPTHLQFAQQNTRLSFIDEKTQDITKRIPKWSAWILLFYFAVNGAFIPPWILSIPAEKYLRIAWRFFMQAMLLIPFVMYEYRQRLKNDNIKKQYTLSHIFNPQNLKKIYLTSFSNSLWFTMVCFGFEWTYVSHSLNLASLQLFYLSLFRKKEDQHAYEIPGQLMIMSGVLLVVFDTLTLNPSDANPSAFDYIIPKYLYRHTWQRVILGDLMAFSVSYIMTKFVNNNKEVNTRYPPHLRMFIISLFNVVNMTMSSYFFSGTDIQAGTWWGWFGLFSSVQFSTYLYMSIILGLGSFISSIFLGKLFEPLDIQTAQSFEPIIATLFLHLVGVQYIPGGFTCIGYVFIIPGLFFINVGQHLKAQEEAKVEAQQKLSIMPQQYQKQQSFKSQLSQKSLK